MTRRLLAGPIVLLAILPGVAQAFDRRVDSWHGSGWLGTAWGRSSWGLGFRRDPVVGVYGARALDFEPYASYRNDDGCARMLPVATPGGIQLRRVFVCDF